MKNKVIRRKHMTLSWSGRPDSGNCPVCAEERKFNQSHRCTPSAANVAKWDEKAREYLSSMCEGTHQFRMSIPVQGDDTDVIFYETLRVMKARIELLEGTIKSKGADRNERR